MFIVCVIVTVLLAVAMLGSAVAKLTGQAMIVDNLTTKLGLPASWIPRLAACEIAGGVGLLVGLAIAPIGILAALGACGYFIGAVIFHVRVGDREGVPAPAIFVLIAVAALVLRILTMPA
jgi:hypothetical protein